MSSAVSAHHCTCPQAIRAENHKITTGKWWQDPRWPALRDAFLKENKTCEFCGGKSDQVHHDNAKSYHDQEEYYKPENFTAACARCHHQYRVGYVICPECKRHYMKPGNDKCRWCVGIKDPGRPFAYNYKRHQRHPCAHRIGQQRCQRNGRTFVCGHSSKKAAACDYFEKREAAV